MLTATLKQIRHHFDFLIEDYGYHHTSAESCARYENDIFYIEIWPTAGDCDLLLGLKKDTAKIRPGMTHLFPFQKLLRALHSGPTPTISHLPIPPGMSEQEHHLYYMAYWVRRSFGPLLRSDGSRLDELLYK